MSARQAIEALSDTVARRRRVIVCCGVLVEAGAVVAVALHLSPDPGRIYGALMLGSALVLVVALVLANVLNRRRPQSFRIERGNFVTPRLGAGVLLSVAFWGMGAFFAAIAVGEVRSAWATAGIVAAVLAVCALLARVAWCGYGVELTPIGLRADRTFTSVRVPWTAFDPEREPRVDGEGFAVRLFLAEQELAVQFEGADPGFVARAIQHYVDHPERRWAIGTDAELDRLHAEIGGAAAPWKQPAPGSDLTRTGFVVRVLLLGVGFALASSTGWKEAAGAFTVVFFGGSLAGHAFEWARARGRSSRSPDSGR